MNTTSVTKAKDGVVYVATGVFLPRNAFPNLAALTTFYGYTTVRGKSHSSRVDSSSTSDLP